MALLLATIAAAVGVATPASARAAEADPLPAFAYDSTLISAVTAQYNPTGEFIFPSVFHAGAHLDDPLGEWYLYYAPHNNPGGISLLYADALDGPWVEYTHNPVLPIEAIEGRPGALMSGHVSTPDAFWHPDEEQLFLYFHNPNAITRYATSEDGLSFEYGGEALVPGERGVVNTVMNAYARVFELPQPIDGNLYGMFFMSNRGTGNGNAVIRYALSEDARAWQAEAEPLVSGGGIDGSNISSANLWRHGDQGYIVYHGNGGDIYARTISDDLSEVGSPFVLYDSMTDAPDSGRAAAPDIVEEDGTRYLFYEAGDRLGAAIAMAKEVPPVSGDEAWLSCPGAGSDEFEGTALSEEIWTRVLRQEAGPIGLDGGSLRLTTVRTSMNGAPLPQQLVPEEPWEVTTALRFSPTATYQQAGIVLYQDDRNYARVNLLFGSGSRGLTLEYVLSKDGVNRNAPGVDVIAAPASLGETLWLRLENSGDEITASYSVDSRTFIPLGQPVLPTDLDATHIGPYALRGNTDADEITAAFDWFQFAPSETELEECAEAEEPGPGDGGPGDGEPGDGEPGDEDEEPTVALTADRVTAGGAFGVSGSGFEAGEKVEVWIHSAPRLLATLTADGDGRVSTTVTVPAGIDAGTHRIRLLGLTSGVEVFSVPFTVAAATAGSLASTGAESRSGWIAVALLAFGGLLVATRPLRSLLLRRAGARPGSVG